MYQDSVSQTHQGSIIAIGRDVVTGLHRNWRARRQLRKLLGFDQRQLQDIGVTREEIAWALQLPLKVNAALELKQVSNQRRQADRIKGIWY